MAKKKIRLLVVDDSMFFRSLLANKLSREPDIDVIGEAFDPYAARDKLMDLDPDIMTLDIEMPNMNGVEFLKILLPQWKIPVIIVSNLRQAEEAARAAGASDFIPKPDGRNADAISEFITTLAASIRSTVYGGKPPAEQRKSPPDKATRHLIALGASTGGTQATSVIVKALPADMPGMVIVQHMPSDFTRMYAEGLNKECAMTVREAQDGDKIEQGVILIAPGGERHMKVQKRPDGLYVHLVPGPKVSGHCPSVDYLFESVASAAPGRTTIGVILTGMGADGASGLLSMCGTGSYTIGQDEASSVVYGMPKVAYDIGAVRRQAPLASIAPLIISYARSLR